MTIPKSVKYILGSAFEGCSGLTEITIPNSVIGIDKQAFRWCKGLKEVTIPKSVKLMGYDAFRDCSKLTQFVVEDGNNNFCTEDGVLFTKDKTTLIQFPAASSMTSYNIPIGVDTICHKAFYNCTGLTSVTIPNSVTSIGDEAFDGCTGLTEITIPNSVTAIGTFAFSGCTGLTSVTIPESVTEIGVFAFSGCTGLTSIYSLNPEPPTCSLGSSVFSHVNKSTCVLYVPKGSKEAYSKAEEWKDFEKIEEM